MLVVEDRARGRLFGALAAAMKDLYIGGLVRPAAFFFDLRVHPDDRVSVRGRHILVAWKAMERWAEERTWAEYGDRDFFPEAFRAGLLSPEMQATGLFSLLHLRSGPS